MWEYHTFAIEKKGFFSRDFHWGTFNDRLNELGREGWELVTIQDISYYEGRSAYVVAVLKRALQQG